MIGRWQKHTGFTPKQWYESAKYAEAFWYSRLYARMADQFLARPKGQ